MTNPALRRVVRRETHSPRTVITVIVAVLVALALIYIGVEIVLAQTGAPALLVSPADAWQWLTQLPNAQPSGAVMAGAIVVALVGLVLVWLGVAPGRLSKQELTGGTGVVVVDNGVIAASLAQRISEESGLARDKVTVGVGHRSVDVTVRPAPGEPLEASEIKSLASAELADYGLARSLSVHARVVRVSEPGEGSMA